jgi:hypothetical protein
MPTAAPVTIFDHTSNGHRTTLKHQSTNRRAEQLSAMHLTERDKRILEAVHAYDGMLTDTQIQRLFFTGRSQMQLRTRLLFQHGYLQRPERRRRAMLPTLLYWLGECGAAYVAGLAGEDVREFRYLREPKWAQVEHDITVNDVRIDVLKACTTYPQFSLEQWIPQSEFWAQPDAVEYVDRDNKLLKRKVRPDGYCVLLLSGKPFRLLFEIDRATEDNPRIAREKVYPGIAYIRSAAYKRRFGINAGRWLFITTGERRLRNMKRQTEHAAGSDARLFYFTTLSQVNADTLLTAPIWWRGGATAPTALFKDLA